jgi:predicted XRE-type DNA-binding protein
VAELDLTNWPEIQVSEEDYQQRLKNEKPQSLSLREAVMFLRIWGFAEPEEELTKAQLASQIRQTITRRRLTQVAAASLMGIDQPKVSALLNGRLTNFSSERLMRLLTALGHDVDIIVKARPRARDRGRIRVVGEIHE